MCEGYKTTQKVKRIIGAKIDTKSVWVLFWTFFVQLVLCSSIWLSKLKARHAELIHPMTPLYNHQVVQR